MGVCMHTAMRLTLGHIRNVVAIASLHTSANMTVRCLCQESLARGAYRADFDRHHASGSWY